MGLEINYWNCEFNDYDETWDGEDEVRLFNCSHPNGSGKCKIDKHKKEDFCKLLEPENTCSFCGVECEDYFCSDDCKIAELND